MDARTYQLKEWLAFQIEPHPYPAEPRHSIRGLSPLEAVQRVPEIETAPETWHEILDDDPCADSSPPADALVRHYIDLGILEPELCAVLAALQESRDLTSDIRREWQWPFNLAQHLWAAECREGAVAKHDLPADLTRYMPALVMFRDGLDALHLGLETLILENLFYEFEEKWRIMRVPAGQDPLRLWVEYLRRPDAEWVEFPAIPASGGYLYHRTIANIAFRLCEAHPQSTCELPCANLAELLYGESYRGTVKRVSRIRQALEAWGIIREITPSDHARKLATTFMIDPTTSVTQSSQSSQLSPLSQVEAS